MMDHGYLQHSIGGCAFRTERVAIRNEYGDRWQALFEGRWRRVFASSTRLWIVYQGERITIVIEGV
jgi:hypothetical protein